MQRVALSLGKRTVLEPPAREVICGQGGTASPRRPGPSRGGHSALPPPGAGGGPGREAAMTCEASVRDYAPRGHKPTKETTAAEDKKVPPTHAADPGPHPYLMRAGVSHASLRISCFREGTCRRLLALIGLSFDCPAHYAFDKIATDQNIDSQRWKRCDEGSRHHNIPLNIMGTDHIE